jgi:hypothetical protein
MNTRSHDDIEKLARRRAGAKLGWYAHATVYVLVNTFLLLIANFGMSQHRWSMFPALGWGLGLALHGVGVFILGPGCSMRERMVQRERERLERERNGG